MNTVLIAAATALALSVGPGHSVVAKVHAPSVQTAAAEGGSINNNYGTPQAQPEYAAAEGGSINNNYGTPQAQPEYAVFVQPTAAAAAPVSL
jgi:hypothetical protein